jgi:hypothetical protein
MKTAQSTALVIATLLASVGAIDAQTPLHLKFKKDDKFDYQLEQQWKIALSGKVEHSKTTVNGAREGNVEKVDLKAEAALTLNLSWQVLDVRNDGEAQIKIVIKRLRINADGHMGRISVDSENLNEVADPVGKELNRLTEWMAGMELTCGMEKTGLIKNMRNSKFVKRTAGSDPAIQAFEESLSADAQEKLLLGGLILPKDAVKKPQSWAGAGPRGCLSRDLVRRRGLPRRSPTILVARDRPRRN